MWQINEEGCVGCASRAQLVYVSINFVENPLLDADSSRGRKLVYGCDGDLIAELGKLAVNFLSCRRPSSWSAPYWSSSLLGLPFLR